MAQTKPWLDYNGETTAELLACKKSHRIDSLLCAFEWGIGGKRKLSSEERVVLSIMALDREVNNGGFKLFFRNSSKSYAPRIVGALETVGAAETGALTVRAIGALKLPGRVTVKAVKEAMERRSPARNRALDALDQEFFQSRRSLEIEKKLFAFIEKNADKIEMDGIPAPKVERGLPPRSPIGEIAIAVGIEESQQPETLEEALQVARRYVRQQKLKATPDEIEAGAHLYLLSFYTEAERWNEVDAAVDAVIRTAGVHAWAPLVHWLPEVIEANRKADADRWALAYLQFLSTCEPAVREPIVDVWAGWMIDLAKPLPRAAVFCRKTFPGFSR